VTAGRGIWACAEYEVSGCLAMLIAALGVASAATQCDAAARIAGLCTPNGAPHEPWPGPGLTNTARRRRCGDPRYQAHDASPSSPAFHPWRRVTFDGRRWRYDAVVER
jgi:hypothetical protein